MTSLIETSDSSDLMANLQQSFIATMTTPNEKNLTALWNQIQAAVGNESIVKDDTLRTELANIWLSSDLVVMRFWDAFFANDSDIDALMSLLTSPDIINTVTRNRDNARVLAFICIAATGYKAAGDRETSNTDVARVVSMWTGETYTEDDLSVEKVCTSLYGAATYAIYRPDVTTDDRLAALLCRQNIPVSDSLLGLGSTCAPASLQLPSDMD